MELVANPGILFLDEPTSGLDASSSIEVPRTFYSDLFSNTVGLPSFIESGQERLDDCDRDTSTKTRDIFTH
jgi:hypothetical protein